MGLYLTSSPVAPLNKEFVETASPLWLVSSSFIDGRFNCNLFNSTDITVNESPRVTFCDLEIYVSDVPTEHLETFDVRLREALGRIADTGLDMQRMNMVIERAKRKVRNF